jgi:hypothetical protein
MNNFNTRIPVYLTQNRLSYTGKLVAFRRTHEGWKPLDGEWVKRKLGNFEANVLKHDTDKMPPKNYFDIHEFPNFPIVSGGIR